MLPRKKPVLYSTNMPQLRRTWLKLSKKPAIRQLSSRKTNLSTKVPNGQQKSVTCFTYSCAVSCLACRCYTSCFLTFFRGSRVEFFYYLTSELRHLFWQHRFSSGWEPDSIKACGLHSE